MTPTTSNRPRILFTTEPSPTRDVYFTPAIMAALEELGDVEYNNGSVPLSADELAERLPGIDICVTHWGCPPFTEDVMRSADRLKLIAHAAGSVGDLVTPAVYERGVAVTTANSAMAAHVAEGTLALLLADLHRVIDRAELMRNGGWLGHAERHTESLSTITVGLVGLGDIGRRLCQLLAPFSTTVLVHDPFLSTREIESAGGRSAELEELLARSNVISLHAALTPQNSGMLNAERLALIRDGALLINTARSGLIDTQALEHELASGRFRAILDVFDVEPLPADSSLRAIPGVTLMPHASGSSCGADVTLLAVEEVARFVRGQPPAHPVTLERFQIMTRRATANNAKPSSIQMKTSNETAAPQDELALEQMLSQPNDTVEHTLGTLGGDLIILGAGGKVGPTLALMAQRALRSAGSQARVVGISQWSDTDARRRLDDAGVTTIQADLADPDVYPTLPDGAAVAFLVGNKFGSATDTAKTWWMNAAVPALAASRYRGLPSLVYSSGNVYPFRPASHGGASELDAVGPVGLYAQSCLAREAMYQRAAASWGTPVTLFRLNYAAELRYGVVCDIARKVLAKEPVDVTMPAVNVVWQGDANRWALASLGIASSDVTILNAAGPETLSVRAIAEEIARLSGQDLQVVGTEAADALLSDARKCHRLFGYPQMSAQQLIEWTVDWAERGGRTLGKPTKFEQRSGKF